jgi:hypothetical protein
MQVARKTKQPSYPAERGAPEERGAVLPFSEVSSKADINKIYPHIQALAEEYAVMRNKIIKMRQSVEEQLITMEPARQFADFKKFYMRHVGDDKMDKAIDKFSDLSDAAIDRAAENGNLLPADKEELGRIIADVSGYYRELRDNLEKFSLASVPVAGESESYDEFHLKALEDKISGGKNQLDKCRADYEAISASDYKDSFDENFLDYLFDCKTKIKLLDGMLEYLESAKEEAKEKLAKNGITDEEAERIINKLNERSADVRKNFTHNISKLESGIVALKEGAEAAKIQREKEVEAARAEQAALSARLDEVAGRLKERAKKKFFVVPDGKTAVRWTVERINEMKGGVLNAGMVEQIEKEAQEKILGPEERSDLEHKKMTAKYKGGPSAVAEKLRGEQEKMGLIYKITPRVVAEKMQIDAMTADFERAERYFGKSSGKERELLDNAGTQLSYALQRNDLLNTALDPKTNTPLDEIKTELEEYDKVFLDAVRLNRELLSETKHIVYSDLLKKVVRAVSWVNKGIFSPEQIADIENCSSAVNRSREMSFDEMDEYSARLDEAIARIDAKKREDFQNFEAGLNSKKIEREFEKSGQEPAAKAKFEPPVKKAAVPKQSAETEVEFFGGEVPGLTGEAPAAKKEIKKSIREMLVAEGVINVSPEQILGLFKKEELNFLVKGVSADVTANNDSNRDEFVRALRGAVKERLLADLDKAQREALAETVPLQVYSLMRDAVKAESDKEILRLQSAEAGKLAGAGKAGAKLLANVGLYAGIGVGAGLVIGSGGAAAATAAAAIALSRLAVKRVAESEIFKKQKEAVGSMWGKTVGRLFKKEQPLIDVKKVAEETVKKIASQEIFASVLSNQLRENSSRELTSAIKAYGENKKDAMKQASPETAAKFEQSLDRVSREFYKNAYNYLAMSYAGDNLSEETLSQMALQMTLAIGMHQRGEVAVAGAMAESAQKADMPEDKNWLVEKMEKFLKFRSEGVGAAVFGGSLAYAVAENASVGRVISGALAGAGLGLMAEKRIKKSEKEKPLTAIEKIIFESEKMFAKREADISDNELDKAKQDMALVKASLDNGALDGSEQFSLRNRAKNFVAQVNRLTVERYEARGLSADDLLKDVSKQTMALEKEASKKSKKLFKIFETKNRALVYMGVGAVAGGALGYLGARLADYLRAPKAETIMPAEHDLGAAGHERYARYDTAPLEQHAAPVYGQAETDVIEPEAPPVHEHLAKEVVAPEKIRIAKPPAPPVESGSFDEWFDSATKHIVRPKGMPAEDFETIMKHLPKNNITEEQYHHMIDVYTKAGMPEAEKYIALVEQGKFAQAEKFHNLIDFLDEERDIVVNAAKDRLAGGAGKGL